MPNVQSKETDEEFCMCKRYEMADSLDPDQTAHSVQIYMISDSTQFRILRLTFCGKAASKS